MPVPAGRGERLELPPAEQIEELWGWVYETAREAPFSISSSEAPHYHRYWPQRKLAEGMTSDQLEQHAWRLGFGVRDGNGMIFVSDQGEVFPAGFMPHPKLGDVRQQSLSSIYRESPQLQRLRDMDQLGGRCNHCQFRWLCGGSRARAYAVTGDLMQSDPSCVYDPEV